MSRCPICAANVLRSMSRALCAPALTARLTCRHQPSPTCCSDSSHSWASSRLILDAVMLSLSCRCSGCGGCRRSRQPSALELGFECFEVVPAVLDVVGVAELLRCDVRGVGAGAVLQRGVARLGVGYLRDVGHYAAPGSNRGGV